MTAQEARAELARRAGVKSGDVPVYFTPGDPNKAPTLQWVRKDRLLFTGKGKHDRRYRRVVVGLEWVRSRAPELWAAFVAAKLRGDSTDIGFIPDTLKQRSN